MKAPLPDNEAQRLESLHQYQILDTPAEDIFDELTRLAAHICSTPIALVSLVDRNRQWFKSKVGLEPLETHRDIAFCAHAILQPNEVFLVEDASKDERFADNPLVTSAPNIRFYAGVPLTNAEGHALGTLCAIDYVPRNLTPEQIEALQLLGRQVIKLMEMRRNLTDLSSANIERRQALKKSQQFFTKIAGGLGIATIILAFIGINSYQSIRGLIDANNRVQQTQEWIHNFEELFSYLKDAEIGQRGYIITGEEPYLSPYLNASSAVEVANSSLALKSIKIWNSRSHS
jgi:hypothetical protein